ncbi:MAG: AAC(3) family N-acetyltransferase [Actinomycetia bacterium]|nr:AAC(3) family N-acetyltransferase [Actinomycetes bacterium]
MSEKDVIKKSSRPRTINTLTDDLRNIGVKKGTTLLVHSSMSSIGWICGGAVSVIIAIEQIIGDEGTLIMPAFSGDLSDPAKWENPPVPEQWHGTIRETMPVFYPDLTPTRGLGVIPEVFRKQRGVLRSNHPQVSFAAWGKQAEYITGEHSLEYAFGGKSPLAKIYELDGYVLLIGIGYKNNTSLHLAECRADYLSKKEEACGTPLIVSGKRKWVDLKDIKSNTEDFEELGLAFMKEKKELIKISNIGQARSQFFRQRELVDFAVRWIKVNRK